MAQDQLFKELLNQVKCDIAPGIGFSKEDLDRLKACVDGAKPIETDQFDPIFSFDTAQTDCIPNAVEELKKIVLGDQKNLSKAVRFSLLRAKVQELRDNLEPVKDYFTARYDLFYRVITATSPFTAQYIYYGDEYTRLSNELKSFYNEKINNLPVIGVGSTFTANAATLLISDLLISLSELDNQNTVRSLISKLEGVISRTVTNSNTNQLTQITTISISNINEIIKQARVSNVTIPAVIENRINQSPNNISRIDQLITIIKAKALAFDRQEFAKESAYRVVNQRFQGINNLNEYDEPAKSEIQTQFSKISSQLLVEFSSTGVSTQGLVAPPRAAGFKFRLIDLDATSLKLNEVAPDGRSAVEINEALPIKNSPLLKNKVFTAKSTGFSVIGISGFKPGLPSNPPQAESDYAVLTGLLYNGIQGNSYPGLYKKITKPLSLLYTLQDRGLTLSADQIDPIIKDIKDAPTSIKEDEITLYIKNQATYEKFYETLDETFPKKLRKEREVIYPKAITSYTDQIKQLARREAATFARTFEEFPLKLARPTSFVQTNSQIFTNGTHTYSSVDSQISSRLLYYFTSKKEIESLIKNCEAELKVLDSQIKKNSIDPDAIQRKISSIPCFKKAADATAASNRSTADSDPNEGIKPIILKLTPATAKVGSNQLSVTITGDNYVRGSVVNWDGAPITTQFISSTSLIITVSAGLLANIGSASVNITNPAIPGKSGSQISNSVIFSITQTGEVGPSDGNDGGGADPAQGPGCEQKTRQQLGKDPLYLRTLSGTDSSLPDLTSQCYWKEFAKALNKVCLLPFPDLTGSIGFRYWPINCIIPAGPALVLLPIPPVWRSLFVLPTPLGTLVLFLTLPIAPIGIPLPSIYLLYIGIDGQKYMAFATNPPLLYAPPSNTKIGFETDNSGLSSNPANVLGLHPTNSYKGQPIKGAFNTSLALAVATAKSKRLAQVAAAVASGQVVVKNGAGKILPIDISASTLASEYLSEPEMILQAVKPPSGEFKKQMISFKAQINKQLDKLGEMQTNSIASLRQKIVNARAAAEAAANRETDPSSRRKKRQQARNLNPLTLPEKIDALAKSFNDHIDNIKFGTFKYPKDPSKFNPELPSVLTAILDIVEMASVGDLKVEASAVSLNSQINKVLSKISVSSSSVKDRFDLSKAEDISEFKNALKKHIGSAIDYLSGKKVSFDLGDAVDPQVREEARASNAEIQKKLTSALALSAFALATPISLNIFDFGKKCCDVAKAAPPGLSPDILIAFSVLKSLIGELIGALDISSILASLGQSSKIVSISSIPRMLETMLKSLPTIPLPNPANLAILMNAIVAPVLTIISIPKSPTPFHLPIIPIVIPMDAILKPIIKTTITALLNAALTGSQIASFAGPNLIEDFDKLTGNDVVELVRGLINQTFDSIIEPITTIITIVEAITLSIRTFSFTSIESSIFPLNLMKLALMALDYIIPPQIKTKVLNVEAMTLVQETVIKGLEVAEPVLKNIAWIGSLALCSLGTVTGYTSVKIARVFNPIMNQDDLPPWERLTHKNPLFAIFLDEIAWRGSIYSTGSLIFQTKAPAVLPYTPIFPIVHMSPHIG